MGYLTDGLTFNVLRDANVHRLPMFKNAQGRYAHLNADGSDWTSAEWMVALVGEVGELANLIKKIRRGDMGAGVNETNLDEGLRQLLSDELADIATYLDLLAFRLNINLGVAVINKWNKVSERVGAPIRIDVDDWHYTKDMP
jgi:NTP pyrophosphatase (non-canonical NTP hydrolase)